MPKEKYTRSDADNAIDEAQFVVNEIAKILTKAAGESGITE